MRGIPSGFVELDPEAVQKVLDGHEDLLSGEQVKIEALYRQHMDCPKGCGRTMQKSAASVQFAFGNDNWMVPRCLMKCAMCGLVLNPFDGMVVEVGDDM